jgi:RNA polymerase sigma-54 factor
LDFIETLLDQLRLTDINDSEKAIAEEILWNLDEQGFLTADLNVIADRFNREEIEIETILQIVQRLEPLGIAARNIRECLLIQLEHDNESLAYKIVDSLFEDFANKRFEVIKRKINCSEKELEEAVKIISHLNPRPGEGTKLTKDEVIVPDLIVREHGDNWVVYTNDSGLPELRINPDYVAMMEEQDTNKKEAKRFLKQRIFSAQWFIQAIEQRRETLKQVMRSIIDRQPEFFSGKIHMLQPMKLLDIAEEIHMDISTISRSTRGKYVDTPYGVFELKTFFTEGIELGDGSMISNHLIKQVLKEIVEDEDKQHPMNDQKLVELLQQKGYPLSRRTVAKYRDQMNVPVARLRRQL